MDTPISPKTKIVKPETIVTNKSTTSLLTPPSTSPSSKQLAILTITPPATPFSPINSNYYTSHLSKSQFNSILVNCTVNLIKILYGSKINDTNLSIFIIEILKRSKTSIQTLQLTCYYLIKLIQSREEVTISDPKKLFLGLIIISSKFNQDYNYSFKSWLKICGFEETTNTKVIKEIEFKCLTMLKFELYLNSNKYENWCNLLMIFGYDFIKVHLIDLNNSNIMWETNLECIQVKLTKWKQFFSEFNNENLVILEIKFSQYFINQTNKKIFIVKDEPPKLLKRSRIDDSCTLKKQRVA